MKRADSRPRLGVVLDHPAQYFAPLFQSIELRSQIRLRVLYANDRNAPLTASRSNQFAWDIDVYDGYKSEVLQSYGKRFSPRMLARIDAFVRAQDLLVIHGWGTVVTVVAGVLASRAHVPYLIRSDTTSRAKRPRIHPRDMIPRLMLAHSAGALATGSLNAQISASIGAPRVFFAPFSIDDRRFTPDRDSHARAPVTKPPVVGFFGVLAPHKRPLDLIDAQRFLPEDVEFLIVGDGPLRSEMERRCDTSRTTFLGWQNQLAMPAIMASCDVLVLPSQYEPWGLVVNEGLSAGAIPVVSASVGCAIDLVPGIGTIFPTGDVQGLVRGIERALRQRNDPAVRNAISKRVQEWSLEATVAAYEQVVYKVTAATFRRSQDGVN